MLYERTLGQWLEHWAETTPDKEYIVYSDRNLRFTWSQFNRRVDDMAKGLISIGVERGTPLCNCSFVNATLVISPFFTSHMISSIFSSDNCFSLDRKSVV